MKSNFSIFLMFFFLLSTACTTIHKRSSYLGLDGNIVMINNRSGRVDTRSFYDHVFSHENLKSKVLLFGSLDHPKIDFPGVWIFLDSEPNNLGDKNKYPSKRLLYLGHKGSTNAKSQLYLPFASTSFTERSSSPLELLTKRSLKKKKYFAAYLAKNCVDMREKAFNVIAEYAEENNLGEVHALGGCHGSHPELSKMSLIADTGRHSSKYLDDAVSMYKDYEFVLTMENTDAPGYVTEKIVNVFLAGSTPIFWGNHDVEEMFNKDAFIQFKDISDLKNILKLKVPQLESMRKSEILTDYGQYLLSWHKDFHNLLRSKGRKTLRDEIHAYVNTLAPSK